MIVIEGKHEKSVKLENLIRKEFRTNKVAVIDTIGIHTFDGAEFYMVDPMKPDAAIHLFKDQYRDFKEYDWIAFYTNVKKDYIEKFKELDREYPNNFILTVQNTNGLTSVYYL